MSGVWSAQEKLLHINLLEMKALFLALQAFQEDVAGHHVTAMCDNSTVVAYVNKQGGTVSRPLFVDQPPSEMDGVFRRPSRSEVSSRRVQRPGRCTQPSRANCGDRVVSPPSGGESTSSCVEQSVNRPVCDLPQREAAPVLSLVPDPQAVFEDAFRHPWDDLDLYAFPPFALVGRVIARVQQSSRVAMTLVAPLWPEKEWFADLLLLLTQPPLVLPCWDRLLRQPHCNLFHQGAHALNLHVWRLSSDTTESRAFREGLLESCQWSSENPPLACTSRDGRSSVVGVVEGALLQSTPLFLWTFVDFLIHLRQDKGLSVYAVKGYCSALTSVLALKGRDLAASREITTLLRSFARSVNPVELRPPAWDVSLVLQSLTGAPYEPLRTCEERFLAQKTLFLLALASAKRIGELHALSY